MSSFFTEYAFWKFLVVDVIIALIIAIVMARKEAGWRDVACEFR
jgi:hypothetical protein